MTTLYKLLAFDCETRPDYALVRKLNEFTPKQDTFDPALVKTGNLKDQAKITAKIEAAEASFGEDLEAEEKKFWADLDDKAALNPLTSTIIAHGFMDHSSGITIYTDSEPDLIKIFWERYMDLKSGKEQPHKNIVGWGIEAFDLVHLIQRSQILGILVPAGLMNGRYYDKIFIDLMKTFTCYQYGQYAGLKNVAICMGLGQPREHGITGKDFWRHLESDRESALVYLRDDLKETYHVGNRILNNI